MNTEITDTKNKNGWLLYDGDCRYCVGLADRFRGPLLRRGFRLTPLQAPWVRRRLGLPDAELLTEMRLLRPDGKILGGADALLDISRQFWWAWPVRLLGRVSFVMDLFRAGYRWVARHRSCAGDTCQMETASRQHGLRWFDFVPLVMLSLTALAFRQHLAHWVFMWAMAFALYGGCKWLTYRQATSARPGVAPASIMGYLLGWPGMNAETFLDGESCEPNPTATEWVFALVKTGFGAALLWGGVRIMPTIYPLLAGWVGMLGVIFMVHFGLFHLLSLAWRRAGRNAPSLMQNPIKATSVAEFWGARWNTAFNDLAFRLTFRPLRRRMNPTAATLIVFGLSGLIHELVISLPARGGYGLPTLYFLAQGLAVITERSEPGQRLGLGHGGQGWLFTLLVTAGPVYWLFHPPFVRNVILPMLTAIGAN